MALDNNTKKLVIYTSNALEVVEKKADEIIESQGVNKDRAFSMAQRAINLEYARMKKEQEGSGEERKVI